jgi:ring-1,2-phenylacetyl-CoA epoxidase subunit PaaE
MLNDSIYKRLIIKKVHEEVKNFKVFTFEENHNIQYKAGQYLTLVKYHQKEEVRRSYSVTSSPVLNEPLSIGVKRVDNGFFSRQLIDTAKSGDEILTTGAGGFFLLPDDSDNYKQLIFFAAGSGITPIFSLIKTALHAHSYLSIVLIYSNASREKAIFFSDLQKLRLLFPDRFHIEMLFSNSFDLANARLHRDLIFTFIHQLSIVSKERVLYYICGPENYMRLCTYTLLEHGIETNRIKKEDFYISAVRKRDAIPPDKQDHTARIHIKNRTHDIIVHYPDSILKTAKKQELALPYSCEAGRCGNCVARCVSGNVWHSYNEVLTEKELQEGLILTCVGHPIGGDVELEIITE